MFIAKIQNGGTQTTAEFSKETLLSDFTEPFSVPMPCGGNHTCGKCKVRAEGALSPLTEAEKRRLTKEEIASGIRMACAASAVGDCTITILQSKQDDRSVMLDGTKKTVAQEGIGIAVDIGTTTIAVYTYQNGERVRAIGEHNKQGAFGADVITRIGVNEPQTLHQTIVSQLDALFDRAIDQIAVPSEVKRIVVTGNTTMLHFFYGYDPAPLAVSPFRTVSLFDEEQPAAKWFPAYENAVLYLPPCISAYVGADMVCAMEAADFLNGKKTALLADIGTNGEMALVHDGQLVTCSTAAGPALEGACIRQGMPAGAGAIDNVFLNADKTIGYHVIGEEAPQGLCGSGLIRLMALLVELEIVDEMGAINEECGAYESLIDEDDEGLLVRIGDSGIILTQRDIRQIQLAKASICAGILTMLHHCGVSADEAETFYICGGFGSYIDPKAAATIGLIPASLADCVKVLGNAAGTGAADLLSERGRESARSIAKQAQIIELSESPFFMDQYVEQMSFYTE